MEQKSSRQLSTYVYVQCTSNYFCSRKKTRPLTCFWDLSWSDVPLEHVVDLRQHVSKACCQDDTTAKATERWEKGVRALAPVLSWRCQAAALEGHWGQAREHRACAQNNHGHNLGGEDVHLWGLKILHSIDGLALKKTCLFSIGKQQWIVITKGRVKMSLRPTPT